MQELEFSPTLLFMLAGLSGLLVVLVLRPGGPHFPIARFVSWVRRHSNSTDQIFEGLEIAGARWRPLFVLIVVSAGLIYASYLALGRVSFLLDYSNGVAIWHYAVFQIPTILETIISLFYVRILMRGRFALSSINLKASLAALVIIYVHKSGFDYSFWPTVSIGWSSIAATSFLPYAELPEEVWRSYAFGGIVFALASLLVVWVPHTQSDRVPRFSPFVQRSWRSALQLVWLLLVVGLVLSVFWALYDGVHTAILRWLLIAPSNQVLNAFNIGSELISGLLGELTEVASLAVLVAVSNSAMRAITAP